REAPDRGLLRVEPRRGGDLRVEEALDGADGRGGERLLPAGGVRGDPPRRAQRGRGAEADRLHALEALPGGRARVDVRLPGAVGRPAPRGLRQVRRGAEGPAPAFAPGDRRKPRPLGRPVDRHRRTLSRTATAAVPIAFLALFFAW